MDESRLRTIAQIQAFLDGSDEISFSPQGRDEARCAHISRVLKRFGRTSSRPTRYAIPSVFAEPRAPSPNGRAGFARIDSVHQGLYDGMKGVYHSTCVDAVSQWKIEASVEGLSEAFQLPVLQLVVAQSPFVIKAFHSDNGSEYINGRVAKLLEKLRIEQTKSRS